jgi:predicted nucleotidyltransferase
VSPRRVWLFGSRARGDAAELSDIDLAIEGGNPKRMSELRAWIDEDAPTLLNIDLVELDQCDRSVRENVFSQGVLLYGPPG